MLKNKNGFQVNISLSIFFIAFCDLFTDFPSYIISTDWCAPFNHKPNFLHPLGCSPIYWDMQQSSGSPHMACRPHAAHWCVLCSPHTCFVILQHNPWWNMVIWFQKTCLLISSIFGNMPTFFCEELFNLMKNVTSRTRTCLTNKHLEECMQIEIHMKPDTESLIMQKQNQIPQ
jgi:hypothetical protein